MARIVRSERGRRAEAAGGLRTFVLGGARRRVGRVAALDRRRRRRSAGAAPERARCLRERAVLPRARSSREQTRRARDVRQVVHASLSPVPIYEYRCPNGHTFEVFQNMADAPVEALHGLRCRAGREAPLPGRGALQGLGLLLDRLRPQRTQGRGEGRRRRRRQDRVGQAGTTEPAATRAAAGDEEAGSRRRLARRRVQPAA